jgi:hypothetical protein
MHATTPAKSTPFGFCTYPEYYTSEPVYFRDGDPLVTYEKPHTWSNGRVTGGWRDERTLEQKNADALAAFNAEKNWRAAQEALAFQERCQREQEEAAAKRVENWKKLFHSKEEILAAVRPKFAIDGFLQENGVTMIGGKSGHGKTLMAMEMARCLIDGSPLFGHFNVLKPSKRVIYLIPESGLSSFKTRIETFKLLDYAGDKFFCRTLDCPEEVAITDRAILKACEGADVFLDTAIRFMSGEENSATDSKEFAQNLFALLRAGARTVTGLHHSPKSFENAKNMSLENILRGSGDIGAMLSMCWGIAQVENATTGIYVKCVKDRDRVAAAPFKIAGFPSIDQTGHFVMTALPGMAGSYEEQKAQSPDRLASIAQAWLLKDAGKSLREIAKQLAVSKTTVERWLSQERPKVAE